MVEASILVSQRRNMYEKCTCTAKYAKWKLSIVHIMYAKYRNWAGTLFSHRKSCWSMLAIRTSFGHIFNCYSTNHIDFSWGNKECSGRIRFMEIEITSEIIFWWIMNAVLALPCECTLFNRKYFMPICFVKWCINIMAANGAMARTGVSTLHDSFSYWANQKDQTIFDP